MIDFTHFVSGGYFVTRVGNPGWEPLKVLLPDRLVSLSSHICPMFNVNWGWTTGNKQLAVDFGVRETQIEEFVAWCSVDYQEDMDIWSMFYSPTTAKRFINRFIEDRQDLRIIGAGLPVDLEIANWRFPPDPGEVIYGIEKRIEQRLPIEGGGQVLGFEVLSFSYGNFGCSWLCNYLHQEMYRLFSIRPGEYGLIEQESEARRVYEWIAEDEMKGQRAEPEPYDYWLLVDYPLNET